MAAGKSAGDQADRSRRAAAALERKAAYASRMAGNWQRGADGETAVARALDPLAQQGWRILHDLVDPEGGNIDHLAIGPPGIAVVDAKNWSAAVTITPDRRLVTSKDDRSKELRRLEQRVELVRRLVAEDGMHVAVRGYVVLCGEHDRARPSEDLGDLRILGVEAVAQRLAGAKGDLDAADIEAIASTLADRLSGSGANAAAGSGSAAPGAPTALEEPSAMFDRAHRFYYLRPWKKGGHNRLYLRDPSGASLGWTDVNTGARQIDCTGDDAKFAEALLAAADPTGVKLGPDEVPKMATQLWGGRLLSRIARFHMSVLVGQEWRNYGKHRLYGTLIDPAASTFHLGYVDLKDRSLHPSTTGPIGKDRGPAERYLGFLLLRYPQPPGR